MFDLAKPDQGFAQDWPVEPVLDVATGKLAFAIMAPNDSFQAST